ncbi:unnamed protein product [Tilletia controversa]|uniref:Protein YTP1-like C-terminal domain-containing protein n=3 Tax=Tilletia TaxID=13289 RepID=A0A8X7STX1_9BASI|nr:hypothetical protein CF336_g6317 [Tilletia laevis]KAE8195365.1 hypothetical protein CF328_g4461 [Tilletia controversa]KAE8254760.1 hypothetical protein A4X03_0g5669 [Tilletia caries]KAE8188040.1 hypothetical protein CF335_g7000 [Tilletia laevis]KAE8241070.1 hypothetical protein A4X06_0g7676 [Tilletia controversa]
MSGKGSAGTGEGAGARTMRSQGRIRKWTLLQAVGVAATTIAIGALPSSTSALKFGEASLNSLVSSSRRLPFLAIRHGDHSHDEEEKEDEEPMPVEHGHQHDHLQPKPPIENPREHSHSHGHSHDMPAQPSSSIPYSNFTHDHGPFTSAQDLPDPWTAGTLLLPIPPPPPGQWGGHHHHHGNAPALTEFNETALFYAKGPAPLSYVEWDMNWGPARTNELRRFVAAGEAESDGQPLMGAVDGRWRQLFDERDPMRRAELNQALKSLVEKEEPARHGRLMAAHIAGCIIACFILLPLTLFFRAANSSLAPLCALAYLITLFLSLLLGGLYKALSPPLFAPNSHGKMGWSLFWISSVIFALDIIRLVRQIISVFVGPRAAGNGRWRTLWSRISSSAGSDQHDNDIALGEYESYSPAEEERMLRSAHADDDNDAEDVVALAKHIDSEEHAQTHTNMPPRSIQRHGSSSSSGSSGRTAAEDANCSSPTGTLIDTPRVSSAGSRFASPWTNNGAARSASPEDLADDLEKDSGAAEGHGRGCGPIRQHRRGLSSISTLWERETSPNRYVTASDDFSPSTHKRTTRQTWLQAFVRYTHVTVARSLPILAFATSYTGLTVYAGACRSNTINVCVAHGVKGGIFFWYGLLTFGRYVGAYAEHGWAWNARPKSRTTARRVAVAVPSAEFVECLVIFIYGATNTWMERFGANAGDPYTVKQVQHISIAVMYWFAGMLGMLIEMGWTKRLLGLPVALAHPSARVNHRSGAVDGRARLSARNDGGGSEEPLLIDDVNEYASELVDRQRAPPSYSGSFNPFPALCIGVTGVAMAAHHQDYVFEVQVHALWGNLLAAFAILRYLTYFFLYLRPATASILPGRPPTEALASLALTCGGVVFMLSSEEVSFLAMRTGWADIMMISNVTVALVCLSFCGIAGLFIAKAWAVKRELGRGRGTAAVAAAGRGRSVASASMAEVSRTSAAVPVFVLGEDDDEA